MRNSFFSILLILISFFQSLSAQLIQDDFEGNGTINTWYGQDCGMNNNLPNPFVQGINTSATVLEYDDYGALYANIGFNLNFKLDLSVKNSFSFKIYVPSSGVTGNQNNQVSLKVQDASLNEPWTTQSEIIKPIVLDQWQTITFNFEFDQFRNFNDASLPPTMRNDFDRVLIQVNGENNTDDVLAYIDDFDHFDSTEVIPVYNQLVWSDEFDVNGAIDSTKWFHQTQLPSGGSWYNNEIQHYTNRIDNSFVDNGHLNIVAKKETFTDQGVTKQYTSARLNSKFAFRYGRVEVMAKMPTGVGTWPAIWTLGRNINEDGAYWDNQGFGSTSWPACGEMDIMEHWGDNQNHVSSATHTPSSHGNTVNVGGRVIPTVSSNFHLYALEWSPERLEFSIDSIVHFIYNPTIKNSLTWPFASQHYILLNIAMESNVASSFTQSAMEIDYIRIYQEGTASITNKDIRKEVKYYPNPFSELLTISVDLNSDQDITFEICDLTGKVLETTTQRMNNGKVTLEQFAEYPAGMYIVSYMLNGEQNQLKVLKQ